MDLKDYLMDELWPLLSDEQKAQLLEIAEILALYAPVDDEGDEDDTDN